jgi:putative transposase
MSTKQEMIEHKVEISVKKQVAILGMSRSSVYYQKKPKYSEADIKILHEIDQIYTENPHYGYRKQHVLLIQKKHKIGQHRVRKYMETLELHVNYPRKKTSIKNKSHKIHPYLLKNIDIKYPNQVWAGDITYIPLSQGFCYMCAIIDWYSRFILSYRISNTLDADFCVETLESAIRAYQKPKIFNSDQGSQYTGEKHVNALKDKKIKISMDSVGRWADNIMIERFFRSLKVEKIYPIGYQTQSLVKRGCQDYIQYYNYKRIHQSLAYKTPYQVFSGLN